MIDRLIKLLPLISIIISITFSSCIDTNEEVSRTEEDEVEELNDLLTSAESKGLVVNQSETGIYYIIHKEGKGEYPKASDTLSIKYSGYFVNGSVFDASSYHYPDSIWTFVYMNSDTTLIEGLTAGLAIMKQGSKYEFIIPSDLAYGSEGTALIPAYTPLIYSIELIDIMPASE